MASVSLTAAQAQWLQNLVNQKVQDESTSNPSFSGEISNASTFQENDLVVAKAVLAAIQSAV